MSSGVDTTYDVHPILVDEDGRVYVTLSPAAIEAPVLNFTPFQTDVGYVSVAGEWAVSTSPSLWAGCHLYSIGDAINASVGIGSFYVPSSGTYTLYHLGQKSSSNGIASYVINGAAEGTIDWYHSSTLNNVLQSVSLGTLTTGLKAVKVTVGSKNASSSAYGMEISSIIVMRD